MRSSAARTAASSLNRCTRLRDRPHGDVRIAEQPDQGCGIPGHAQRAQPVQGVDPQVTVRGGQQPCEGLRDRGSFESQADGGDRGPAPHAWVRVLHQRDQHLGARLRVAEPAQGQGGGRAHGGRGVARRLGEDADVLGPVPPAQPLDRRRAPLRGRRRRLAQEESDLMARPHDHLPEGKTSGGRLPGDRGGTGSGPAVARWRQLPDDAGLVSGPASGTMAARDGLSVVCRAGAAFRQNSMVSRSGLTVTTA